MCIFNTLQIIKIFVFQNVNLKEEIETLRANQEQLITENERLREQLSIESSMPKSIVTEFCNSVRQQLITRFRLMDLPCPIDTLCRRAN